jgi:vacuolar-type H+-ATPase subunit D/Vma8
VPGSELDEAGAAYRELLVALVALADAESVRRTLERGLQRTARRLGALETLVLPRLRAEIRQVAGALEEEERDEALRRRGFLKRRARSRS